MTMKNPGVGVYELRTDKSWNKDIPVKLKSRQSFFYDDDIAKNAHCISPQTYLPNTKCIENARYRTVGFGVGLRSQSDNPCT
jgi:hypothetical protein